MEKKLSLSTDERIAVALEAMVPLISRVAIAIEDVVESIPSSHDRILEQLYAGSLVNNTGEPPNLKVSEQLTQKLQAFIKEIEVIANLADHNKKKKTG